MSRHAAKTTSKGQVAIPKPVRDQLDLQEGDYLVLELKVDCLVGTKAPVAPTDDFDELARRIAARFKKKRITLEDVEDAIGWARESS